MAGASGRACLPSCGPVVRWTPQHPGLKGPAAPGARRDDLFDARAVTTRCVNRMRGCRSRPGWG
jgi:hypothetical protein